MTSRLGAWAALVLTATSFSLAGPRASLAGGRIGKPSGSGAPSAPASRSARPGPVTIRAAGRGNPSVSFADGRALEATLEGGAASSLAGATPLALASADFDEDGVPDLVATYATGSGGAVAIYRGNPDTIYPNEPEAVRRRAESGISAPAPFFDRAETFATAEEPDFVAAGDFDGDGHRDLLVAATGGEALVLMPGDGKGRLGEESRVELSSRITAMAYGEGVGAHAYETVAVAVDGEAGPRLLVFPASLGALEPKAEALALASPATSLVVGRVDSDTAADVVAVSGRAVTVVWGSAERAARSVSCEISVAATSLVAGAFGSGTVGVLGEDGTLRALAVTATKTGERSIREGDAISTGASGAAARRVKSSANAAGDDVAVCDPEGHAVRLTTAGGETVAFEADEEPVAVLPMRLNSDGLDDLVVLSRGGRPLSYIVTTPLATFNVTNLADDGPGSLRDAIAKANASPGPDEIDFNIAFVPLKISLASDLPTISETVTIDAASQPGFFGSPIVEIDGTHCSDGGAVFFLTGASSVLRGFVVNRASVAQGVALSSTATGSIVEGNYVGTNTSATAALPNLEGVAPGCACTIGGGVAAARNVISGNTNGGVVVHSASGVVVQGNVIGTNLSGTTDLGNGRGTTHGGVSLENGVVSGATIGGTFVNMGNVIAYNGKGVRIDAGTGNSVLENAIYANQGIGIDLNGDGPTPNDPGDGDDGANHKQNAPVITSASANDGTFVSFFVSLDSTPNATFRFEFFATKPILGASAAAGRLPYGTTMATANAEGQIAFGYSLALPAGKGLQMTATATSPSGDTSEFSTAVYVDGPAGGADTAGVYAPSTGAWFLKNANAPGNADLLFGYGAGGAGLVPLHGDWDGNGVDSPGLYNPASGAFFLRNSSTSGGANVVFTYGAGGAGFVPIAGDWNGDGIDTVGLYQPATGTFFLRNSNAPGAADVAFVFGGANAGFTPIAGDWNGDGIDTVGLYSSASGAFFLRNANAGGGADATIVFGAAGFGWRPVVGDWNGDGVDTIGVYAPPNGTFFLRDSNAPGGADATFGYGAPFATPVTGDWDGL